MALVELVMLAPFACSPHAKSGATRLYHAWPMLGEPRANHRAVNRCFSIVLQLLHGSTGSTPVLAQVDQTRAERMLAEWEQRG